MPGPWRSCTRSDFRLTKRGTGRPLATGRIRGRLRRGAAAAHHSAQRQRASPTPVARANLARFAHETLLLICQPKARFASRVKPFRSIAVRANARRQAVNSLLSSPWPSVRQGATGCTGRRRARPASSAHPTRAELPDADIAQETSCHRHAQAAGGGGNPHARAVRCAPQPRRQADEPGRAGRGHQDGARAGSHHHRPHRPRADRPGRTAAEADRQFWHRRRQYRRRDRRARHHRHQHARRSHRGHRRHDHGADPGRAAPAGGRRGGAEGHAATLHGLGAHLDAGPPHAGQAARHRRHGPHRPGGGAPRQGVRAADPLSQPQPRLPRRSSRNWRPPIGTASTRCWRAWTSSRSTARTRRPPIICCRRGG